MFAIACGYEDADDCDALRGDPLFKLAVGRAPKSGRDLCSQPACAPMGAGAAHHGRISKIGRSHARAMLVEAA